MKELNPQAQRIYDILKDFQWHCPISWGYADGHTKRITDINEYLAPQGLKVDGGWCDCGRHVSKIKKRRLVSSLGKTMLPMTPKIKTWNEQFKSPVEQAKLF